MNFPLVKLCLLSIFQKFEIFEDKVFFSNKTSTTTRTAEDAKARISLASEEKPLLYPQITTSFYLWTFSSVLLDYFFRVIMGLFLDADGFFLLVVYYLLQWAKIQKKCNLGKLHSLPLHQSLKINNFLMSLEYGAVFNGLKSKE